MTPEAFLENFGHLADGPNGVQKIRELILQLAVQGKLVRQNPDDSPACKLLKEIEAERQEIVKEGTIKKYKLPSEIKPDELSYPLPMGWEWVRLGDIGEVFNGNSINASQKGHYSKVEKGLPFIATKDVGFGSLEINYDNGLIVPQGEKSFKIAHQGAVLICSEGGSAGRKIGLTAKDICFGNKLFANETHHGIEPKYIFYLYQSKCFQLAFRERMTGIIGGISKANFVNLIIPLPPTAEQKRIITKVDQLMVLCDELEERQNKKLKGRVNLNNSALDALLNSQDAKEFAEHWQRICDNFDLLYDHPETIEKLRSSILQLAVQGKLVLQDPRDEPASVLREKIKAEREKLVKKNVIRKIKDLREIDNSERPHQIPSNWEWVRLGDLALLLGGYAFKSTTYVEESKNQIIRLGNVKNGKLLTKQKPAFIPDSVALENTGFLIKEGDVLITMTGTRGKKDYLFSALVLKVHLHERRLFLNQRVGLLRFFKPFLPELAHVFLKADNLLDPIFEEETGTANQGNIGSGTICNSLFPLPPLEEQKRIVTKLNQLMSLCDALEQKLNQAQSKVEKYAQAVVIAMTAA